MTELALTIPDNLSVPKCTVLDLCRASFGTLSSIVLLSRSNNLVFLVETADGRRHVVKILTDKDVDAAHVAECNQHLARYLPVARIAQLDVSRRYVPYDVMRLEYVEGASAAQLLVNGSLNSAYAAQIADLLALLPAASSMLPMPESGFGVYRRGSPLYESLDEFIYITIERYCARIRELAPDLSVKPNLQRLMKRAYESIASVDRGTATGCLDANLKNIMVKPDGRTILLNAPMIARTDPLHSFGAILAGTRASDVYQAVLQTPEFSRMVGENEHGIRFFETLGLLGILAFAVLKSPDDAALAPIWGTERAIVSEFNSSLAALVEMLDLT